MALCHMTEPTNGKLFETMMVIHDVQLSKDFEEMNFISIVLPFKSSHNVMYVCMYSLCYFLE